MELVTQETVDAIQKALAPVAEKIGQGASFAWDVVVQQQRVYAWLGLFWAIVGIVAGYVIARVVISGWEGTKEYDDARFPLALLAIFGGTACLVAFFGGSATAITHFLNPNYYAIQFFINLGSSVTQ